MPTIIERLTNTLRSKTAGAVLFTASLAATIGLIAIPQGGSATPTAKPPEARTLSSSANGVTLSGSLSQKKIIQGADGVVYLELSVDTPADPVKSSKRNPVDMVVVLDRSGSMAAENRLPYAKSAINDLLSRLNSEDRFGLITFETGAAVVSELAPVTDEFRARERQVVASLTPAGSTNMSGGLDLAKTMVERSGPGRVKKVVLLSDGEANLGITDQTGLAGLARSFGGSETILSTIGMGLGFNEALMASLADHGMGNFSYLESLANLGDILNKDLESSRSVFAASSGIELRLPAGIRVVDAGGYPTEQSPSGDSTRVLTGQLLSGLKKSIFITLSAPTASIGKVALGDVRLSYTKDGTPSTVALDTSELALEIVEPSRRDEAIASVDKALFKKTWAANNLGRMQQEFSREMKAGSPVRAKQALESYRAAAVKAEAEAGVPVLDAPTAATLDDMASKADDSLVGSGAEQAVKQNRAAKAMLVEGRWNQSIK